MRWSGANSASFRCRSGVGVRLKCSLIQAARDCAADKGVEATVIEPHKRKHNIRDGGYGENVATNRYAVWSH